MRLSKFTDYSLRVLIELAQNQDELTTVSTISKKHKISRNHLVKVVHNLSLLELVQGRKGKGGGISLNQSAERINIGTLIRLLEGESNLVECFSSTGSCPFNPRCKLKMALFTAQENFYKGLAKLSLKDLI